MVFLVIYLVGFGASIAVAENCDKLGTLVYEDMNCKPIYDSNNLCPLKYDCKGLRKSNNTCYYKGKSYKIDEQVDSALTAPSCDLGCYCSRKNINMTFNCAALDCPEWLHQPKPGCYRKYSLEACCSVREICPPFDNSTKCWYDGKEYKEGENFLPKDSCWRCVCQNGFRGKVEEPFCRRRACGVQVKHQDKVQKMCAPVYFIRAYGKDESLCCPKSWICPEGDEKIIGKPKSGFACRFGKKPLKIGQYFTKITQVGKKQRKISCHCKVPPMMTCITEVI